MAWLVIYLMMNRYLLYGAIQIGKDFSHSWYPAKKKHAVVWCYHQRHKIQDSIPPTVVGQKTQQRQHSDYVNLFPFNERLLERSCFTFSTSASSLSSVLLMLTQ